MACAMGSNCREVTGDNEEVIAAASSETSTFIGMLATLQADIDMLKVSMKNDIDEKVHQAQAVMEGRIDVIKEQSSVLEDRVNRLETENNDKTVSPKAQLDPSPHRAKGPVTPKGSPPVLDTFKVGMKNSFDEQVQQAQAVMERRIDIIKEQSSVLEERVNWLEAELSSPHSELPSTPQGPSVQNIKSLGTVVTFETAAEVVGAFDQVAQPSRIVEEEDVTKPGRISSVNQIKTQERIDSLRYELKESVWDALILIRLDLMHVSDEITVCILALFNLILQLLFIVLIGNSMLDQRPDFGDANTIKDLLDWRVKFAHAPKYADTFTNTPLAQAVCTRDMLNMQGTGQAILYSDIDEYLANLGGFKSGDILCMLVILLWLFTCIREWMTCRMLCQAMWVNVYDSGSSAVYGFSRLMSARTKTVLKSPTLVAMDSEIAHKSVAMSLSFWRACAVSFFAIAPRFCVLVSLGYVGVRFLIITIKLEELILNAVALEVILHVDEMIYDLFAPHLCRRVLLKVYPFRLPKHSVAVSRTMPYVKLFAVGTILMLIRWFLLEPILKNLGDAEKIMCGGNLDFLFVELANGPVLAGRPSELGASIDRNAYIYRAVLQRTGLDVNEAKIMGGSDLWYLDSDRADALFPITTVDRANFYDDMSLESLASLYDFPRSFLLCHMDKSWTWTSPSSSSAISKSLENTFGIANHTCQKMKNQGYCNVNSHRGAVQRFFCPYTCGIHTGTSGLTYRRPDQGAPIEQCDYYLRGEMANSPMCADLSTGHPAFQVFADSMYLSSLRQFLQMSQGNQSVLAGVHQLFFGLVKDGCGFAPTVNSSTGQVDIASLRGVDIPSSIMASTGTTSWLPMNLIMCDPEEMRNLFGEVRSFRFLCPVSCGCSTKVKQAYLTDGKPWTENVGMKEHCAKACFV